MRTQYGIFSILLLFTPVIFANSDERDGEATDVPRLPVANDDFDSDESDETDMSWPRIIGGTPVALGEFKGIVSIQTSRMNNHFCGGTLITANHVLTAAHCIVNDVGIVAHPSSIAVMGNDLSISRYNVSPHRQVREVELVFAHPNYSLKTLRNDVAVLRVKQPFNVTYTFGPVPMSTHTPPDNLTCHTGGWGATVENGTASLHLLGVNLTVIPKHICNAQNSYGGMVKSNMFCAGAMDGGRDSCQGDSGGGLICNTYLSGIVSFGYGCGRRRFPGIYTDVVKYQKWIHAAVMWNDTQKPPTPTTVKPSGSAALTSTLLHYLVSFLLIARVKILF